MTEPWLVVVDMQQVFTGASPWASPQYDDAAAGIARLLPRFGDRVVLTRYVAPQPPTGAWVDYFEQWPFALVPPDDPLYDLTLDPGEHRVVTAPTFGKWGAELAEATGHADQIVLTGVSTDCCVLSTALPAADAGVRVVVPADACGGATPEDHRRALDAMGLYAPLVEISTVDEVLASSR
ncbi:Nicotinamidase-related amidase [Nocardioides terrae]|uniref:Nicotinamidase-related amidase n=1 Tax=Nocardioides terrae TaxID=574651 RepID=A0A1I1J7Y8_9ACTN|nr:cysteine hydrolase [Nocardioides terrae]SFC42718.1 Nicotinamidase-related amidase [Nocardioides terrae]